MRDRHTEPVDETKLQLTDFDTESKDDNSSLLGKGSFAAVHMVRCKLNNKKYALKVVG